jgi:ribosomal protein L27
MFIYCSLHAAALGWAEHHNKDSYVRKYLCSIYISRMVLNGKILIRQRKSKKTNKQNKNN